MNRKELNDIIRRTYGTGTNEKFSVQPKWNYEPCKVTLGKAKVIDDIKETWWCYDLRGTVVGVIQIVSEGRVFYIFDDDAGRRKVFNRGGGPDSNHKGIEVLSDTFEPTSDSFGKDQPCKYRLKEQRGTKGPRHQSKKKKRTKRRRK